MSEQIALSIKQPWAWLIVNAAKDVENRSWPTRFRGRCLIHASKTMTRGEYDQCFIWVTNVERATGVEIPLPWFETLKQECGGIVGVMKIVDCVETSPSPWFGGKYGFVIDMAASLPFQPCKGSLGFFKVNL